MSGFDLVPVDGGAPVHLPPGETVLGRGPLLGVNDKRVSRRHGLLQNLNGQLRLKPTHMNPCFAQSSPADPNPRPLKKDSWYRLRHGDFFSLLPGQFVYKVVAVGGAERTPRNSQSLEEEEEEELPGSPKPHVEAAHPVITDRGQTPPHQEPTLAALSDEDVDDKRNRSFNKGDSVEDDHSDVAPSVKRRVLPAWMMAAAAGPHRASSSPRGESAVKRSKAPAGASTSTKPAAAKQATPTATEGAELSEEEKRPRKRRRKISDEEEDEEAGTKTDVPSEEPAVRFQRGSNRSEVSAESDNFTMELEEEEEEEEEEEGGGGGGREPSSADRTITTRRSGRESEKEDEKSKDGQRTTKRAESIGSNGGAASTPSLRTACPYGKDCYRKNPVHFQECSHPGDTDYEEEEEEEEEADRPECPYGTDCYRKNPLHRKEYKHTKKPARATRAAPKKTPAGDEDEDEDSFINDDSEDVGDDSDYVPPDSDDSGKEDIKRLQREAKVFLKRRK
ncbi:aprataxin and PNK-like factor [Seriola aureovittata]|uniref:aprataxin and PNK-like factor n=1 Tax=Seriola aureovittata TaxID=2871759 RepID=UPI0024BDFBA7|nr:aprataxin and PNK-like factor [Seriola aureovittata]